MEVLPWTGSGYTDDTLKRQKRGVLLSQIKGYSNSPIYLIEQSTHLWDPDPLEHLLSKIHHKVLVQSLKCLKKWSQNSEVDLTAAPDH